MKPIKKSPIFSKGSAFHFSLLSSSFTFLLLTCNFVPLTFADAASASYVLTEDLFSAGQGSASSAGYQVTETSFNPFAQASMSSTNFSAENKTGIAGAAPIVSINAISPTDMARYYSDQNASYTVTAVDPDNDTLQYRAKQDGTTKSGPQASNTLTWPLSGLDLGRRVMKLEVIDPDGTVVKPQSAFVLRRPVK